MPGFERRVVITGLGLVTPLGDSPDRVWTSIAQGHGAVRPLEAFKVAGLPNDVGAEVADFDLKKLSLPRFWSSLRKSKKYLARDIQLAVAAAQLGVADANLVDGGVDPTRIGIDLGAGLISSELDELAPAITHAYRSGTFDFEAWGRESIGMVEPIWLLKYLPNMLACHISIMIDCQGPSNTITEGDASSIVAMTEAARIIARGRADVMISGGADSKIHPLSLLRMAMFQNMSGWKKDAAGACRPFDSEREGWVPGEGAGILILEERSHAAGRGARIYGEILGGGSACDARPGGGLDPDGCGVETAIRAALAEAGLTPADIGHVNAHGAATRVGDMAEARAIARVFGPRGVPVTALKGYMGNLAAGSGGVELAASLVAVNRGRIPPVLNCDHPDPACELDLVLGTPRATANPTFVTLNFTPLGQAAALVVRGRPSDA
jgi:3-oxoacyl-[acyl-carrier-protein] synthase II